MPSPAFRANGGLTGPTRLLYLSGKAPDKDAGTLRQLSALGEDVHIAMVASASDVLARLREADGYHALLISHTLPAAQTLSIIASLRKATAPIAILPVVTESQRELSTSAVAIGADDTLILLGGTLLHPVETLVRAKQSRHVPAHPVDAGAAPDHGEPGASIVDEAAARAPEVPAPEVPPLELPTEEERRQMRLAPRAELESALGAAGADLKREVAAHAADRAAWNAARQALEARVSELEEKAAQSTVLEAALTHATAELHETMSAQIADRGAWETTRHDLERTIGELEAANHVRGELEFALAGARAELRKIGEAHASERASWEAARRQLEAQLHDPNTAGRAELERAQSAAAERLSKAETAHRADRAAWEETRRELERRVSELEAAARGRAEAEAALDAARADLERVNAAHAAERTTWESSLRDAERRAADLEAQARTQSDLEAALESARADLRRMAETHAAERAGWEETRQRLERDLHESGEARAADRMEWAGARAAFERRLLDAASVESSLTRALGQANAELANLGSTIQSLQAELEETRSVRGQDSDETQALRAELDRVAARHDRLARSDLFGYGVTTIDGWLVHCNDAFARIFGYSDASAALAAAADRESPAVIAEETIPARSIAPGEVVQRDSFVRRADDRRIRVLEAASLVPNGAEEAPLVDRVVIDLSERDTLQEHLRQARRLEAAGRLAASIAPDVDALASLVDMCAQQFAQQPAAAGPVAEFAEKLRACAADTIPQLRQLLAFSQKQARDEQPLNLGEAVERAAPVLARLVSSHVSFNARHGESGMVAVDEEDLEQMLTTLVVTARDLLPVGGSVVVETGTAATERDGGGLVRAGAVLAVTASGRGVQPASASPSLAAMADRCGATLRFGGTPGKTAELRVLFTRCGG